MMNNMTNEDFDAFKAAAIRAYTHGWCHIMALAIQKMVGGVILAKVCYTDEAIHDEDFQVDHLVVRLPSGNFLDAQGIFDTFEPDHDFNEIFEVDEEWILEQVQRGELCAYTEEDVVAAGRIYSWIS